MTPVEPVSTHPPWRTAVFVDRDGVINKERRGYVTQWDQFQFLPGAIEAMVTLARAGLDVLIVTNQSAIHRGIVSPDDVRRLHQHMVAALHRAGGRVLGVYVCPHTPDEECACRKPRPGLLLQAAAEHGLDLARCYLIGDKITDIEAGLAAGCRCMLVLTGLDAPPPAGLSSGAGRYQVFPSIREAVNQVLDDEALLRRERSPETTRRRPEDGIEPVCPLPTGSVHT